MGVLQLWDIFITRVRAYIYIKGINGEIYSPFIIALAFF